jgi:hypothetical protein
VVIINVKQLTYMASKKLITFTDRLVDMVQELENHKGFPSFSAVVHSAIIEMHSKTFPGYIRPLAKDENPADRLKRKQRDNDVKKEMVRADMLAIVEQLGGKVAVEAGKEFCVYFTYAGKKRFEQKVPIEMLSSDLVKTQYQPTREKVEQLQKEGKVDY